MRSFRVGLLVGSMVALLVGVFLIFNALSISVVQRRREIGVMRALGLKRGETRGLFVAEGLLLGAAGSALGCVAGLALARAVLSTVGETVSQLYARIDVREVILSPRELAAGLALGLSVSLAASLWPASDAARTAPATVMRERLRLVRRRPGALWATDALALAFAAAFLVACFVPPFSSWVISGYGAMFFATMCCAMLTGRAVDLAKRLLERPAESALGTVGRVAVDALGRDRARTAIAVAALALGVSMTVSVAGFLDSFKGSVIRWVDLGFPADLFVTAGNKFGGVQNVPMSSDIAKEIEAYPEVAAVDRVRLADVDYRGEPVRILALDAEIYRRHGRLDTLEGDDLEAMAGVARGEGVLISENMSRRFDLHMGDTFTLDAPSGPVELKVLAVYFDYTTEIGLVFVDLSVYQPAFGDKLVDTFEVYLHDAASAAPVRDRILGDVGERFELFVLTNGQMRSELVDTVEEAFRVTHALELVAVIIALLGIVNTLLAEVLDRTRVIGIMRAVGATRRQIASMMVVEATLMGAIGAVLGVLVGLAQTWVLLYRINLPQTGWWLRFQLPWADVAQLALVACVVAGLAGFYPARKASRLPVVEAIEYE